MAIMVEHGCCWHRLGLFSASKQDSMIMMWIILVRLLLHISDKHEKLFRYVPDAYIGCVIDTFHYFVYPQYKAAVGPHNSKLFQYSTI